MSLTALKYRLCYWGAG